MRGQEAGPVRRPYDNSALIVRNNSGSNRRRGDILELTTFDLTDLTDDLIWMVGGSPTLANSFVVLMQDIPSASPDNYGRCLLSGICKAYVNIADTDHKYATVSASTYVLQSTIIGPARIIANPSGATGEQMCAVLLNDVVGECLVKNATGSDIAINSSGTFQLWTGTPGSEAYANCDITAYNKTSQAFKNGKFGAVSLLNGQAYAVPYQT